MNAKINEINEWFLGWMQKMNIFEIYVFFNFSSGMNANMKSCKVLHGWNANTNRVVEFFYGWNSSMKSLIYYYYY
jgi:hypothetical protein